MPQYRGNRLRGIRVSLCCGVFTQGIFMSGYSPQVNNARANTCPHGLPLGACPICNGMGGGGSTKKADEPRRPGEMTYQECYAQWKQMQRAEAMDKAAQEAMLKNAELASKLQKQLAGLSEITTKVLDNIQNALPKPIAKAFEGISNNIIKPLVNIIKNIPEAVKNIASFVENIKTELIKAQEKIAAVVGEVKNFIEKKISDSIKSLKKRFKRFFSIFGIDEEFEEDEKIRDEMSVFKNFEIENLKEAIRKLLTPRKKDEEIATIQNKLSDTGL